MNDKKIDVEETIKAILEQEGKETGIKLIRDIVNTIARNKRKKQTHRNTFERVAFLVYELRERGYKRVSAVEEISERLNISSSTINNHLRTFNKKAREDNYLEKYELCMVNKNTLKSEETYGLNDYIKRVAEHLRINQDLLYTYYRKAIVEDNKSPLIIVESIPF